MYRIGQTYRFKSEGNFYDNTKHRVLSIEEKIIYMLDLDVGVIKSWHADYLKYHFTPELVFSKKKSPLPGWW